MSHEIPKPGSIGTGLDLLAMLGPREDGQVLRKGTNLTPEEQMMEAIQRFRQIGLDRRGGTIITDEERDKRAGELFEGLPDKVQAYFRGKVKGTEITNLRAILEGKEINDIKPKSKKERSRRT